MKQRVPKEMLIYSSSPRSGVSRQAAKLLLAKRRSSVFILLGSRLRGNDKTE